MEQEIKDFFHAAAPQPVDDMSFRLELNARLEAVEQLRHFHNCEISRIRRIAWASLAIGLSIGVAVTVVVLLYPSFIVSLKELFLALLQPLEHVWKSASLLKNVLFWFFAIVIVVISVILPIVFSRDAKDYSDYFG